MAERNSSPPTQPPKDSLDFYFNLLGDAPAAASTPAPSSRTDINDEITREQKLKNDDAEQDIALKRKTLWVLFWFLAAETLLIFMLTFFQAIRWPFGFHLDEWSFKLVVTATILQITGMLYVAVRYLFPHRANDR
ncbi:MAG TPA: hypothetical protein VHT70_00915 [Candidatus Saccharimonadales bacterium]|jgi:hypothetical protein|nr:hypothetical protein [Candidatus Saccharimonadales bacterium]